MRKLANFIYNRSSALKRYKYSAPIFATLFASLFIFQNGTVVTTKTIAEKSLTGQLLTARPTCPSKANFSCSNSTTPCGAGTQTNPFIIANAQHFVWLQNNSPLWAVEANRQVRHFCQVSDIDLNGSGFRYITSFLGVYHGQGHAIKNYLLSCTPATCAFGSQYVAGFFQTIKAGSTIENLRFVNPKLYISVADFVSPYLIRMAAGVVAGYSVGTKTQNISVLGAQIFVYSPNQNTRPYKAYWVGGFAGWTDNYLNNVDISANINIDFRNILSNVRGHNESNLHVGSAVGSFIGFGMSRIRTSGLIAMSGIQAGSTGDIGKYAGGLIGSYPGLLAKSFTNIQSTTNFTLTNDLYGNTLSNGTQGPAEGTNIGGIVGNASEYIQDDLGYAPTQNNVQFTDVAYLGNVTLQNNRLPIYVGGIAAVNYQNLSINRANVNMTCTGSNCGSIQSAVITNGAVNTSAMTYPFSDNVILSSAVYFHQTGACNGRLPVQFTYYNSGIIARSYAQIGSASSYPFLPQPTPWTIATPPSGCNSAMLTPWNLN